MFNEIDKRTVVDPASNKIPVALSNGSYEEEGRKSLNEEEERNSLNDEEDIIISSDNLVPKNKNLRTNTDGWKIPVTIRQEEDKIDRRTKSKYTFLML